MIHPVTAFEAVDYLQSTCAIADRHRSLVAGGGDGGTVGGRGFGPACHAGLPCPLLFTGRRLRVTDRSRRGRGGGIAPITVGDHHRCFIDGDGGGGFRSGGWPPTGLPCLRSPFFIRRHRRMNEGSRRGRGRGCRRSHDPSPLLPACRARSRSRAARTARRWRSSPQW